jgi:two-component system, OmpR family, sensor histidine kinase VanS
MKTIKTKIVLIFGIFMLLLILCGILLNVLFLNQYYIYKYRADFITINREISREYLENRKNLGDYIDVIDRTEGISCLVLNKNKDILYNSASKKVSTDEMNLSNDISNLMILNDDKLSKTYVYSVIERRKAQLTKLVFMSRLSSGETIILRKPLKGINESASIANQFYLFEGILLIIIGGGFILAFSRKITKPIIEMSNVAESISDLDFNRYIIYNSKDELGSLAKSINKMSVKLSENINSLTQDVERRKQLVRNISHELKTPIGVIKGYAEGLKFGLAEDTEKANKYCTVIAEECDHMDWMVKDLLSYSMLESGSFQLNISSFDVVELIKEISQRFELICAEKEVSIESDMPEHLDLFADRELIGRAINNFLINALAHLGKKKYIKLSVVRRDTETRISVFNIGDNIPENELKNIWDVFYKLDKSRSRKEAGHGLGLSIVKLIAELHHGSVGVENLEAGVMFFIDIP